VENGAANSVPVVDTLRNELVRLAAERGFVRAGVARAGPLEREAQRLRRWLAAGRHGQMDWFARTAEVRGDVAHAGMLPGARSVIALAAAYARSRLEEADPARPTIARYARGRDYHNVLRRWARPLVALLRSSGHGARCSVDTLPVLERAWAQRAGIGFAGKNCCLIVPGVGSHVLLAVIVTTAELEPDEPMAERCGACRRCLDACPTGAFVEPRELDARRCISYLTIEHRGPIDEALRERVGRRLFGCDACQDPCPFNSGAGAELPADGPFAPRPWPPDAGALVALDEAAFDASTRGSPLRRAGREGLARNAAIALGNAGTAADFVVLERAAAEDPSEVVRDASRWAMNRLASRGVRS